MRKYAFLQEPIKDGGDPVVKIMFYEGEGGCYLFEYRDADAVISSSDIFYLSREELMEDWDWLIDEKGWIDLEDPLPGCQHDAFIPLRVKGRDAGKPEWGKYETLEDGVWVDFRI